MKPYAKDDYKRRDSSVDSVALGEAEDVFRAAHVQALQCPKCETLSEWCCEDDGGHHEHVACLGCGFCQKVSDLRATNVAVGLGC